MPAINFENNFGTSVTSDQTSGVTTTPIDSIPTVDAPYYIALDATNANSHYEVVYVTSDTATNINHSATTYAHTTTEEVRMVQPASFINTMQEVPEGGMINGKLSVLDVAGLTVALKTQDGGDPSVTEPVFVKIGGTMRVVTAALSVAKADATNWCNSGSTELATKEIDYFAYLGYNATDGVVIGFSRYPGASSYDDFSSTTTNEKYCAISDISNAAATDYYNVIGRFAATLSAGAGYTWTVPTFTAKNLIQRPIYETRWLDYVPRIYGATGSAGTYAQDIVFGKYKIRQDSLILNSSLRMTNAGSWTSNVQYKLPFTTADSSNGILFNGFAVNSGTANITPKYIAISNGALNYLNWSAQAYTSFITTFTVNDIFTVSGEAKI